MEFKIIWDPDLMKLNDFKTEDIETIEMINQEDGEEIEFFFILIMMKMVVLILMINVQ